MFNVVMRIFAHEQGFLFGVSDWLSVVCWVGGRPWLFLLVVFSGWFACCCAWCGCPPAVTTRTSLVGVPVAKDRPPLSVWRFKPMLGEDLIYPEVCCDVVAVECTGTSLRPLSGAG